MNEQIDRFLEQAADTLEAADLLLKHEHELALANRAYYAVFYCISALLLSRNVVTKSHEGARSKFHELFVKTRQFTPEISKLIARSADARQSADYNMDVDITEEQAHELLTDARHFYALTLAYFREHPPVE